MSNSEPKNAGPVESKAQDSASNLAVTAALSACSYPNWHKKFKGRTIQSVVIPLSQSFVDFLSHESFTIPDEVYDHIKVSTASSPIPSLVRSRCEM